ncbi:amidohydrolase family protein [Fertoeibacter niger]|nr:amidohydrolase family protein [Fertoeibacter niger]
MRDDPVRHGSNIESVLSRHSRTGQNAGKRSDQGIDMPAQILFRNATVLTMDSQLGDLTGCDLLVEGSHIAALRPSIHAPEARVVDCTGQILMPGFVDTHRHTWQCLLRNTAVDWSLGQYFGGVRGVIGGHYSAEDMYVANYCGAIECLHAGITTLYDWSHNNNSPDHADGGVTGLFDAGIRAVYGYGNSNAEWIPVSSLSTDFDDLRRVRQRYFPGDDGLRTMAFAARGPQYATLDVTEVDFRTARDLGLRITVHAGSGHWGKQRPVSKLHSRGLLFADTIYVHCCSLAEDEMDLIAESGGHVSCSPEVELNMGHGWPATLRALRRGLRPSISIDVTTSIGGDMFSAMRAMMGAARAQVNSEALDRDEIRDRPVVTSRQILEFATIDGARACGLDHRIGSLTPGKEADLIVIETASPNMFPLNYPVGAVVESAHAGNVVTVLVAGRPVKFNGKMQDFDMVAVKQRMERARDELFSRAGIPADGTWYPQPHTAGTMGRIHNA